MSETISQNLYDLLIGNTNITDKVSSDNIHMGININEESSYPCIVVTQDGGNDIAQLGYSTASSGNKYSLELASFQIDIYNQSNPKVNLEILDVMKVPLMNSGYVKQYDNDVYEDNIHSYRKITKWQIKTGHND